MAQAPVVCSVAVNLLNQSEFRESIAGLDSVPEKTREFILAFFDVVSAKGIEHTYDDGLAIKSVSRLTLQNFLKEQGQSSSNSLVTKRLKELTAHEVFTFKKERDRDDKLFNRYTLKDYKSLIQYAIWEENNKKHQVKKRTKTQVKQQRDLFISQNNFLEGGVVFPIYYMEGLGSGILDSCMRISSQDTRKTIESVYEFNIHDGEKRRQENVLITASCLSQKDSDIMVLTDQRCTRSLNTMFINHVRKKYGTGPDLDVKSIPNNFVFDINDLCKQVGLPPTGTNIESVRKMLSRLRDTVFNIDASDSDWFKNNYSRGADVMEYRYITEWYIKKDEEVSDIDGGGSLVTRSDRYYSIKFHDHVFYSLLEQTHIFISPPELARERSGIAQRLFNWSKPYIGVRPKPGPNKFVFQMDDFKRKVMSSARLGNFIRDFVSLLQRECVSGTWDEKGKNKSLLYGYYFEYNGNEDDIKQYMKKKGKGLRLNGVLQPLITVYRDIQDEYVGDNSAHNEAIRRQLKSLTDG